MKAKIREAPKALSAVAITVVCAFWFIWYGVVLCWSFSEGSGPSAALQSWAQLGDSFGVLKTLFSGLALAAVALALWEQIQLQKDTQRQLKQLERQVELGVIQSYLEAFDLNSRLNKHYAEAKEAEREVVAGGRLVGNLDAISRRLGARVNASLDSILEPSQADEQAR